jgi:long-chain acyl-CoA synthetase
MQGVYRERAEGMGGTATSWAAASLEEARTRLTGPGGVFEVEETLIRGIPTKTWKHAPATIRDLFLHARGYGSREFVTCGETRIGFEDFSRAALAIAAALKRRGIGKGDRVALAMRNTPEWVAAYFGAALTGAVVAPLNAWWSAEELAFGLNDSGARIAFCDETRWRRIESRSDLPALEHVFVCGEDGPLPDFASRLEADIGTPGDWHALPPGEMPDADFAPDDDLWLFYTSGTTVHPRGAVGSHRAMLSSIQALGYALARDIVRAGGAVPPGDFLDTPQRAILLTIPLFHVLGCFAVLGPSLYIGAKLVLMTDWNAAEACRLIEREKIAQVWGVPAVAWELLECPVRPAHDLSSLRLISYGGAPFSAKLADEIRRTLPHAFAASGWGMTETAAICTSHSGGDYLDHPASCGLPAPVCDLKVMSLDGTRELTYGETGELWAKGPNLARGYWNRPDETAQNFVDGWMRTGDLAQLDADGFCTVVGRVKDMLIRGGENIYCAEVEHALCEHPAVSEAAVVPIENRILGEEPGAVVRLKAGWKINETELKEFVKNKLAAFKVPVQIAFWQKPLPRNAAGKLIRSLLKQMFPGSEKKTDG